MATAGAREKRKALFDFEARNGTELGVARGEVVEVLGSAGGGRAYSYVQNLGGTRGFVPDAALEAAVDGNAPLGSSGSAVTSFVEITIEGSQAADAAVQGGGGKAGSRVKKEGGRMDAGGRGRDKLGFTLFSHNLGYASAAFLLILGPVQIGWGREAYGVDEITRPDGRGLLVPFESLQAINQTWLGVYCTLLGAAVFAFEFFFGLHRRRWAGGWFWFPARGVSYMLSSTPCFLGYPTMLAGITLGLTATANFLATHAGEHGDANKSASYLLTYDHTLRKKNSPPMSDDVGPAAASRPATLLGRCLRSLGESTRSWMDRQREQGEVGKLVVLGIYLAVNVALFVESYVRWHRVVDEGVKGEKWRLNPPEEPCLGPFDPFTGKDVAACLTTVAPIAKAFGQLLNFNCALLLFPVLRLLLRKLNNFRFNGGTNGLARSVARYIPLRKNIIFHKLIAVVILFASFGHILAHLINYAKRPEATREMFGLAPWLTGSIIVIAMVIIYSGAQSRVKEAHYEIFWFSHHFFAIFFIVLLAHGPRFYMWGALPLSLYLCERLLRIVRKAKPFLVASVNYEEPILCLTIFPKEMGNFSFREGQYVYLNCPRASAQEWHPFTISSPADDLDEANGSRSMTIHIRVNPSQWTGDLMEYFASMAASSAVQRGGLGGSGNGDDDDGVGRISSFSLDLTHIDGTGQPARGKHLGPDGRPLLCIDGPHSAPCQHYSEYGEIMLVGSGIGLTPSASIIQAILKHKWRRGYSPEVLHFFWIVRHSEIRSFRWFIEILSKLEEGVARDAAAGGLDNTRRHEIQIYVTRAPKKKGNASPEGAHSAPSRFEPGQGTTFTADDLEAAMLNPSVPSKEQFSRDPVARARSGAKHVMEIWNGRPDWSAIFANVKAKRAPFVKEIGVCFCGANAIGKDLKTQCRLNSSIEEGMLFSLHKENF